jgi:inorganic pyrophosphatase
MEKMNVQPESFAGKKVHIVVDRPIGYNHKGIIYPVNYGYIPGVFAGDGEEQDVYILGIGVPLAEMDGIIIGAALRKDDVEDKLIAAPEGMVFSREEMEQAVRFQEQYFDTRIIVL